MIVIYCYLLLLFEWPYLLPSSKHQRYKWIFCRYSTSHPNHLDFRTASNKIHDFFLFFEKLSNHKGLKGSAMWVGSYRSCACALDSGTSGALAAPSWLARRLASQLSVQQCGSGGSGPRLGIRLEDLGTWGSWLHWGGFYFTWGCESLWKKSSWGPATCYHLEVLKSVSLVLVEVNESLETLGWRKQKIRLSLFDVMCLIAWLATWLENSLGFWHLSPIKMKIGKGRQKEIHWLQPFFRG